MTKVFGVAMTLLGAALGGVLVMRYGIMRPLLVGAILVAGTTLCFSFLATQGHSMLWLGIVIVADNMSGGLATGAFIAYLSALINKSYTATQYALLSSLMGVPRVLASAPTGYMADFMGWFEFFVFCALIAIPGMLILRRFRHWSDTSRYSTA